MSQYLKLLERYRIEPNFWCSEEYFKKAGLTEHRDGFILSVLDGDVLVFPQIDVSDGSFIYNSHPWASLPGFIPPEAGGKLLDYEYLFDPVAFDSMVGKEWMTFRKNVRKFPARYSKDVVYEPVSDAGVRWGQTRVQDGIRELFIDFLEHKGDEEIHDAEVMERYLFEGERRWILVDSSGRLMGINVWDSSWKYLNFRFCVTTDDPFLSEYMRYRFYCSPPVRSSGKLVNDGGVLDKESLKQFKDKMNPKEVRVVTTYI